AGAGIGCHLMSIWMDRQTAGFTAMGGEGAQWIGQAPFSTRDHFFQNLGDGTYTHSGSLAIRFAVPSGVHRTYKLLYNDAVAMTGGQPAEGALTVEQIAAQVRAEGVSHLAIVSDEPDKYAGRFKFPEGATVHHREDLDEVQRRLREVKGVSVLIYDQTCAAEKRRRRKRGEFPDPDKRVIINELVCEGCGDCGVKSNCVSVQPLETEFGRKRLIDQSNCNKDFSCVNGFCPSFVTVHGAELKKPAPAQVKESAEDWGVLPEPELPDFNGRPWNIIVTGVGGTGVVTVGAILGMAAHLEGKACGMIDMAGLAQKGGAVFSHVRLAEKPQDSHAIRVFAGAADLILGCDLVVTGMKKVLAALRPDGTTDVVNTAEEHPGEFTRNPASRLPSERIKRAIAAAAGEGVAFVDATGIATAILGNAIAANMFMLGFAYQRGKVPVSAVALEKAIELNGQAVGLNKAAFLWGRRAALEPARIEHLVAPTREATPARHISQTLDEIVERRV